MTPEVRRKQSRLASRWRSSIWLMTAKQARLTSDVDALRFHHRLVSLAKKGVKFLHQAKRLDMTQRHLEGIYEGLLIIERLSEQVVHTFQLGILPYAAPRAPDEDEETTEHLMDLEELFREARRDG